MFKLHMRMKSARQDGFTLTELAVIIAMVGLLGVMAFTALAHSRPQSHLIYCASNMRQVGLAFQMYTKDYAGKLPRRNSTRNFEYDWEFPAAPDSPMKLILPYIVNAQVRKAPVFACPGAKPPSNSPSAPSSWTDCNFVLSDLVLHKGIDWALNPGGLIMMQENLYRMGGVLYEPEKIPGEADRYTQWHCYGPSHSSMFPQAREYFNAVHDGGGNLLYLDGHVGYKRSIDLNSLDFGLVGLNGQPSPYQPTWAHSTAAYLPAY